MDLISERIAEAEARGDFDNLPGAGKPLPKCDDPENALLKRLATEAGGEPEFVSLGRQLKKLREELNAEGDRTRRMEIMKEMSMMEVRIDLARTAWRK